MSPSTSTKEGGDWIKLDLHIHTLDDPKDKLDYSAHELLARARRSELSLSRAPLSRGRRTERLPVGWGGGRAGWRLRLRWGRLGGGFAQAVSSFASALTQSGAFRDTPEISLRIKVPVRCTNPQT